MNGKFIADADKITWAVADLPNESFLNVMKHYSENLLPSMQSLNLTAEDIAKVQSPVLTIHGTRDRQAPYGGGREWALTLPDARLVTLRGLDHFQSVRDFGCIDAALEFLDAAP